MKIALQVVSIICVAMGGLAILGNIADPVDAVYGFIGGGLFLAEGVLALIYISKK